MTTATLTVKAHVRRRPLDPFEAIRAAKHEELRRDVARETAIFRRMERALEREVAFRVLEETCR